MTEIMEGSYTANQDIFSTEYWRAEAERWKTSYETIRLELDEYTVGSQDLERELDQELTQCKQKISRLQGDLTTLMEANRSLKAEDLKHEKRIVCLEEQLQQSGNQRQSLLQQRRELEQKNDEMETSQRILTASLSDQTKRVEELIEAKALLESELEQTRRLQKETEQRLRDELKDLRDELAAQSAAAGTTTRLLMPEEQSSPSNGPRRLIDDYRIIDSESQVIVRNPSTTLRQQPATGYYSLDFTGHELRLPNPRDRIVFTANGAKHLAADTELYGDKTDALCSLVQKTNDVRI